MHSLTREKQDPVRSEDYDWWLSAPPSSLDLLQAASLSLHHRALSTRPATPTEPRAQRASRAAAPNPWRGYNASRAPVYLGCKHCCCCCNQQRCRPRGYGPRGCMSGGYNSRPEVMWLHLAVMLEPIKWYQVVGSMQCSYCRAQGRHQMTSWMCQSCAVPLCLMPYRNCFFRWQRERS